MKCEFEGQNENQKQFSYSKKHFLGVSQSDFVFRIIFTWMKTQKHDLKLNWQTLIMTKETYEGYNKHITI